MIGEKASGIILLSSFTGLWTFGGQGPWHRTSCSKYLLNGVVTLSNAELLCCLAKSITLSCMPQCDFTKSFMKRKKIKSKAVYRFLRQVSFSVSENSSSLKVPGVVSPRSWDCYCCHGKPMKVTPWSHLGPRL